MKKLLYSIATLAILCFAAGCQREVDIDPVKGELVETEFVVTLDDATVTKAAISNDAANIDKLIVAAFKKSDGTYLPDLNETNGNFVISPVENNGNNQKQFSVQAKLVRNFQYTIAFFAMHDGAPYTLGTDGSITMAAGATNDETLDAFYKAEDITLDPDTPSSLSKSITLTRPLAQINILSDPADWAAAKTSGITTGLQSSISIAKAPNKLALYDGAISGETTLAFTQTAVPAGDDDIINVSTNETAKNAHYVAMAYVLSSDSASPVDVTFAVPANGTDFTGFTRTVENVPNRRNYRTNLHGDLFTTNGDFTVVIDPSFGGNDNQDINVPQPTVSPLSTIPDAITTANPGIQQPTITTGNNVTTNMADGKLFFGIDSNSDGAITYSSSDHNVGTIDNNGVFTPVGPGTTNITVTQAAGTQTKAIGDPLAEITIVYHVTVVETTYAISKNTPENGTLAIKIGENEVTEAAAAATITVATEPAAGYELATLTYTPEGESPVDIKDAGSFTMPAKAVEVNATFSLIPPSQYAITKSTENGTFKVKVGSEEVTTATEGATVVISDYEGATGYEFASVSVKKNSNNDAVSVSENSFTMPGEAVTVTVTFSKINYTITKASVSNGTITVAATAQMGDVVTLSAEPDPNYHFGAWTVTKTVGGDAITVENDQFTMPAADVTVSATFIEDTPTTPVLESIAISGQTTTFTVGDKFAFGGTVTASYDSGNPQTVTTNLTYTIDGNSATPGTTDITYAMNGKNVVVSYTENGVTVSASAYAITVNKKARTISFASSSITIDDTQTIKLPSLSGTVAGDMFSIVSDDEYVVSVDTDDDIDTDLVAMGEGTAHITVTAIDVNDEYADAEATYTITVEASAPSGDTYTVTVTQPDHGTISLKNGNNAITLDGDGKAIVEPSTDVTVIYTDDDYAVDEWSISGASLENGIFTMPSANVTITATTRAREWKLVTNASNLATGDRIVLVATVSGDSTESNNGTFVNGGIGSGKFLTRAGSVTISNNKIADIGSAVIITLGKDGSDFTLTTREDNVDCLIGTTAAKTMTKNNESAVNVWSITINSSDSKASITASDKGTIQYNRSSPRFLNYTSNPSASQVLPWIYRYE